MNELKLDDDLPKETFTLMNIQVKVELNDEI